MASDSASEFNVENFRAKMAARRRVIGDEPLPPGAPGAPEPQPAPGLEPWASTRVGFAMPFANLIVEAPYNMAARFFKDECFRMDDGEKELIEPATEELVKWLVWKLSLSEQISHPITAFLLAAGGIGAAKWGEHQSNLSRKNRGLPPNSPTMNGSEQGSSEPREVVQHRPVVEMTRRRPVSSDPVPRRSTLDPAMRASVSNLPSTQQASRMVNGRTEEFEDGSLYAGSRVAENLSSSTGDFVVADE